jgi:hypothetical protein
MLQLNYLSSGKTRAKHFRFRLSPIRSVRQAQLSMQRQTYPQLENPIVHPRLALVNLPRPQSAKAPDFAATPTHARGSIFPARSADLLLVAATL